MSKLNFEKRIGWDWEVFYIDEDTGQTTCMSVFGAMSIDEALRDARSSWNTEDEPEMVGIKRLKP